MTSNTKINELPLPPQPINHPAFTLLPPAETSWVVANMSQYNLSLAKRGKARDESYAIQVMLFQLPTFKDDDELKEFVKIGFIKDTNETRFKTINSSCEAVTVNKLNCIRNRTSTEDTQAIEQSSNNNNMSLVVVNYACKHPTVNNAEANISYSHGYYVDNTDSELENHSKKIINNFNFRK